MKVAIVGSRPPGGLLPGQHPTPEYIEAWKAYHRLIDMVRAYVATLEPGTIVVSGGAKGVDQEAARAAKARGLNIQIHYPNWEQGRGAGFARNRAIVHAADVVTAFWDGSSRGTRHTIGVAHEMSKPIIVVTREGIDDSLTSTTMRAFGPRWTNPMMHIPMVHTPVGSTCGACSHPIARGHTGLTLPLLLGDDERGPARVAFHRACYMSTIVPPPAGMDAGWTDEQD